MAPSLRTHKYKTFLMKKASSMSFFVFYTPQQNEVAERKNRTLIEMIRIMLDEYKTFDHFWAEVVNMTCHVNNRLYLHKLLKKTSHEFLTGKKPSVSYFRVFRSKYYVLQNKSKSSKFSTKVYECFLLSYDSNSHAYCVFNKDFSCVEITFDVVFDETNGSQEEQVDLNLVDGEEATCDALQKMVIGDVRPHDPSDQPEDHSLNDTTPLTQERDQDHQKDQDEHEDKDKHNDQVQ
jgi:hypothetical protein